MIEVPAAVAIAAQLAREASFFSIGTNDLVQYVMAADRTNARVATIADPLQPAVLRMLGQTIDAARRQGIPVTLCGELAADTLATPLAAWSRPGGIQRQRAADSRTQTSHRALEYPGSGKHRGAGVGFGYQPGRA